MDHVKKILKDEFGPIDHVTKISGDDQLFSFAVGFKYDADAYDLINCRGSIESNINNARLVAKPTAAFQACLKHIEETMILEKKEKEK